MKKTGVVVAIICIVILLVSILCFINANHMSEKQASVVGGCLSVISTMGLGLVAYWQNKKYKQLSDESNKRTEQMMFTPEFHIQMIHNQSYAHEIQEIIYTPHDSTYTHQTSIVCAVLNLPMINIKVKQLLIYDKNTLVKAYEKNDLQTNMLEGISIVLPNESFSLRICIPLDVYKKQYEYHITLQYQNIYQSDVEKDIIVKKLPIVDELEIVKVEKARLCDA